MTNWAWLLSMGPSCTQPDEENLRRAMHFVTATNSTLEAASGIDGEQETPLAKSAGIRPWVCQ